MNKSFIKVLLAIFLLLMLTGCGSEVVAPEPKKSLEDPPEKTDAIVEVAIEGPKPLPKDETINYVDTEFMDRLIKSGGVVSRRTSYNETQPEWDFVLIDSRPPARFHEGHIPGAINIPDDQWDSYSHLLPKDKNTPLYFYCGGLHCHLSPNSAKKAMEMGYTNVFNYQEGEPFWLEAGNYLVVTEKHIEKLLSQAYVSNQETKHYLILDVRPYAMYFEAHIPNSIPAPDDYFSEKFLPTMPQNKNIEIITYCGGFFCSKSHIVADILVANGYKNVKVFSGGMPTWTEAKLPVFGTKASGASSSFISQGGPIRGLGSSEWQAKMTGSYVIVDVRDAHERDSGAIRGSIHIPSGELRNDPQAASQKLPANKNTVILIHCATGARSVSAAEQIVALGYENTFYLNNRIIIDRNGNYSF